MNLADKLTYLTGLQAQAIDAQLRANETIANYKAQTKAILGLEDGQPLNLLQIATLIRQIAEEIHGKSVHNSPPDSPPGGDACAPGADSLAQVPEGYPPGGRTKRPRAPF